MYVFVLFCCLEFEYYDIKFYVFDYGVIIFSCWLFLLDLLFVIFVYIDIDNF